MRGKWFFTFGQGHACAWYYVELHGSSDETRARMGEMFGLKWSQQYTEAAFTGQAARHGLTKLRLPFSLSFPAERDEAYVDPAVTA